MKRLLLITAVLGGVALIPLAARAQRGGMAHGGVAVSHSGAGFARATGGVHTAAMRVSPMGTRTIAQRTVFPRNRFVFNRFNRFNRFRNRRFLFNTCFNTFGAGFGCSNSFLAGGLGFGLNDPFFDPFYSGLYDQPQQQQQQQPVVQSDDSGNREVAFEMQALRDEVAAIRDENRAREEARNTPSSHAGGQADDGNATLVFRDGRQLTVRNYAIADHTIWVLGANNAKKISVAELDLQATEQANAKNGVEFRLPH